MKHIKAIACILTAAVILAPMLGRADITMKQKHHTDAMKIMGQNQPAKDEIHTVWMAAEKARTDGPDNSSIVRLDKSVIILLDHKKKTYTELPVGKGAGMPGMTDEQAAALPAMIKNMMKTKVTVTPTGEKKKINDWDCTKYIQTIGSSMGKNQSEIWATEDIKVNKDVFIKLSAAMMAQNPGFASALDDLTAEMKKIKGIIVYTSSSMDMMKTKVNTTTELLEIKEESAPAGTFDIPAGYTKATLDQK